MGKKKTPKRVPVPKDIEGELLANSRHMCNMCQTIIGQIAHIDDNPSNFDYDNLIVLCPTCHARVHQKGSMSKGFSKEELLTYKSRWEEAVKNHTDNAVSGTIAPKSKTEKAIEPLFTEKEKFEFDQDDLEINRIIENELKILLSPESTRPNLMDLRDKYSSLRTIPMQDIATHTLEFILKRGGLIRNFEMLSTIVESLSLFKEFLPKPKKKDILDYFDKEYFETSPSKRIIDTKSDLYKYTHDEFHKLLAEVTLRNEYEKRVEQERKEKESLLSQIEPFLEDESKENFPEFLIKTEVVHAKGIWYADLGLKDDPFPGTDGFMNIDEVDIEKITVITDIFKKFKEIVFEKPTHLKNRIILILGTFGSGKTSLFQYLTKIIHIRLGKITSVVVPLGAKEDINEIESDFREKLNQILIKNLKENGIEPSLNFTSLNEKLNNILQYFSSSLQIKDFFIFIDDLHKPENMPESALGFIERLQIFKNQFVNLGFSISIFISGIENWQILIDGRRSISGAIDEIKVMSQINELDIEEMINRRFKVYAIDQAKSPNISKDYVKTLVGLLKRKSPSGFTFRDVIKILKPHLENYEFEMLQISELTDTSILFSIISDLNDNAELKKKLDALWVNLEKNVQKFNIVENLLQDLFKTTFLLDRSEILSLYSAYFIILARVQLIKKANKDGKLVWILDNNLREFFEKIEKKYAIEPKQYLSKLYVDLEWRLTYEQKDVLKIKELIKSIKTQYDSKAIVLLDKSITIYSELFQECYGTVGKRKEFKETILKAKESIENMLRTLLYVGFNKIIADELDFNKVYDLYLESWFSEDIATKFYENTILLDKAVVLKEEKCRELLHIYFETFSDLRSAIFKQIKFNAVFKLDSSNIWRVDKKHLNHIRRNYANQNYREAMDKAFSFLLEKTRFFIINYLSTIFGNQEWRTIIDMEFDDFSDKVNPKKFFNNVHKIVVDMIGYIDKPKDKRIGDLLDRYFPINTFHFLRESDINSIFECYTNYEDFKPLIKKMEKFLQFLVHITEDIDQYYRRFLKGEIPHKYNLETEYPEIFKKIKDLVSKEGLKDIQDVIIENLNKNKTLILDLEKIPPNYKVYEILLSLKKIMETDDKIIYDIDDSGVLRVKRTS